MARVLVIGGSGMVGHMALADLIAESDLEVHALLRRPVPLPSGVVSHIAVPGDWPNAAKEIAPEILISTLGTTIRQAGSQPAFRAVDHDLVLAVAAACRGKGAGHMIAVSSVGASAEARAFYLRTKGEVEAALTAMDFTRLDILRPGLLRGERSGPPRFGERAAMALAPMMDRLLWGGLDRYRSIAADAVAGAIAALARESGAGRFVHHNRGIWEASEGLLRS